MPIHVRYFRQFGSEYTVVPSSDELFAALCHLSRENPEWWATLLILTKDDEVTEVWGSMSSTLQPGSLFFRLDQDK